MKKELLKGLSNEQIAKIKKCKNTDEILALAKSEGTELTEEQLVAVSGGGCFSAEIPPCPQCNSKEHVSIKDQGEIWTEYECSACKITWTKTSD